MLEINAHSIQMYLFTCANSHVKCGHADGNDEIFKKNSIFFEKL
jgi:hypothetical protein